MPHVARKDVFPLCFLVSLIKKKIKSKLRRKHQNNFIKLERKILGQASCKYRWLPRKKIEERKRENHAIYKQFHSRKRLRGEK